MFSEIYPECSIKMADSVSAVNSTSRVYSSSLLDVCRHVCEECGDEVEHLEHHALEEHQGVDQGSNQFSLHRDFDIQRWHKCSVCGEDIYFSRSNLKTHLKQHNLSFKNYASDHLSRDIGKSGNTDQDNELDNDENEEDDDNEEDVEEVREEDREFSNSFADIIKVKCSICGNNVEEDEFKNLHLDTHCVKLKEYYAKYGRPEPTKKIYHKCQICQKILLFTRSSLSLHICQYHKMKMKLYSQNFMNKTKSETSVHSEAGDECTELYSNDYKDECTAVCKVGS
ncbi:uncharacterized protein LOC111708038 [Eurytemora carolleeae]|uniref:uncharacterized protein LOC111708038 n=1 Tax=Eurytemora carolleeae TaxID=1294199 RepID=UPI000C78A993|nr:uncharacterized protein LOC111708038 [Eurytemora carolleeae]|eukprot:XP_023337053.1 uncharacterized protein LOC111708038 [Eurytemora affinis]